MRPVEDGGLSAISREMSEPSGGDLSRQIEMALHFLEEKYGDMAGTTAAVDPGCPLVPARIRHGARDSAKPRGQEPTSP